MSRLTTLFTGLSLALLSASTEVRRAGNNYAATCQEIAATVSSASKVYYAGSPQYTKDNEHWTVSSSQVSACSFEPATPQDVGIALQILAKDQTPFAVRGGGHSTMPGFSSTPGVQIAMYSFSEVTYDPSAQTATIGTGLVWDDVYTQLEQLNVTVVGGKSTGVGVAGVILGGGYSYFSNQYGLAVDNVVSLELVMPNGTITTVTSASDPDLFFGLRGGFNNFGIVTTVTLKAYPLSAVWGGRITYAESEWDAVNTAIANFVTNGDPKACIHSTRDYLAGTAVISIILFYDAPQYANGVYDELLSIPYLEDDLASRSYSDLILTLPTNTTAGYRGVFHWVALDQFTVPILEMLNNQSTYYGKAVTELSGKFVSYEGIPFLTSVYDHAETETAFPSLRDSSQGSSFINVFYGWTDPKDDDTMLQIGAESVAYMKQFIVDAGQGVGNALLYPNCAPPETPMVDMYGDALQRLQSIKFSVDPTNVMNLTGGWRF
ncbi:FAD-binding domain-containing protein [Rhizopogon vinicolor AM-OR11-026]|uniref:FAD-binding domain-containing protein n=1 Tax=Rhizopogon vinicolor AM-OR11-026 TaxID=1314800 RepID=A0A1B7MZL6_9AGAM|nr:FAD-binding domain-containing protein [Rhizopogon vinicolor AM-OR11-026]